MPKLLKPTNIIQTLCIYNNIPVLLYYRHNLEVKSVSITARSVLEFNGPYRRSWWSQGKTTERSPWFLDCVRISYMLVESVVNSFWDGEKSSSWGLALKVNRFTPNLKFNLIIKKKCLKIHTLVVGVRQEKIYFWPFVFA